MRLVRPFGLHARAERGGVGACAGGGDGVPGVRHAADHQAAALQLQLPQPLLRTPLSVRTTRSPYKRSPSISSLQQSCWLASECCGAHTLTLQHSLRCGSVGAVFVGATL